MIATKSLKSVSFVINPTTFSELQIKSDLAGITLEDLYIRAIELYLKDCKPNRLKVFAAPESGKRIRVNMPMDLHHQLSVKISAGGFHIRDVIYTAFECMLDSNLKKVAA